MEYTHMYYGFYSNNNAGTYQMAVAYFFVMFCCFSLSFIAIVRHTARYFKQGHEFNEFNSSQYFNLVFCYWDFSITSEKSAKIKKVWKSPKLLTIELLARIFERDSDCSLY